MVNPDIPRKKKPLDKQVFFPAYEFEPEYIPKIGLTPFEVGRGLVHPGSEIFNLIDVTKKSNKDIINIVKNLDPRVLQSMPAEVMQEINSGNISHVFQTDPKGASTYGDLPQSVADQIKGKGSIYFRTKEGRTARWKLPEIANNDAGWNANMGGSIFMDQTIYSDSDNIRSLSGATELQKSVSRGLRPSDTVDQRILTSSIYDQIVSKSKYVTGAGDAVRQTQTPSPATTVTTPTTDDLKKAIGGNNLGTPTVSPAKPKVNPTAQKLIDTTKAELEYEKKVAIEALPSTRKAIEESGYLYHYAPREARDSILSGGLKPSQARTAIYDVLSMREDSSHVPKNSIYFFTDPDYAPSAEIIFGATEEGKRPDLYRVKIEPGMLDDMVVDPRLPVLAKPGYETTGIASAVIVPSKTDSFKAELIGERAVFDEFSGVAKYTPINQPSKPTRTVTKRRKVGKPVLSVGQKPPPPTKAGSQQTAATVTQSGNATPKPQAVITSTPKPTSTGAPLPATSPASRSLANNMSEAITKGIKGSGSLKMLGAAALVGLGASAISRRRTQQENIDRRLEMQRRGIIT